MDECQSNNGGCDTTCNNTIGSFQCSCETGYTLAADGLSCQGINRTLPRNCDKLHVILQMWMNVELEMEDVLNSVTTLMGLLNVPVELATC